MDRGAGHEAGGGGGGVEHPRWKLYRALGYCRVYDTEFFGEVEYPIPEVREFHNSDARIRIVTAPARTSKSFSSAWEALPVVLEPLRTGEPTQVLICGPEYDHAEKEFRYLAEALLQRPEQWRAYLGMDLPDATVYHHRAKQGRLEMQFPWGARVVGASSKEIKRLFGDQWDLVILSEAALQNPDVWYRALSTRTKRAIFPTTPAPGGIWIKEIYEEAVAEGDSSVQHFVFPWYANPNYDKSRFDEELARRGMDDPYFREQFLGDWEVWYGGRVFGAFKPDPVENVTPFVTPEGIQGGVGSHCIEPFRIPDSWMRFGSIDFGFRDPTCHLWFAVSPRDEIVVYDEYYAAQRGTGEHLALISQQGRANGTPRIDYVVRDKHGSAAQIAADMLMDYGFATLECDSDRLAGRLAIQDALDRLGGEHPRLRIVKENCPNLVRELCALHYDVTRIHREGSREIWLGDDHAVDALRYGIMSRPAPRRLQRGGPRKWNQIDVLKERAARRSQSEGLIGHGETAHRRTTR